MDPAIVAAIITGVVSLIAASGGWLFAWRQSIRSRREFLDDRIESQRIRDKEKRLEDRNSKVERVLEYIDENAVLISLYRLLARDESWLAKDERGQLLRDADGKPIVERRSMEPEPEMEDALIAIQGTDIRGAIAQQKVRLLLNQGAIDDLLIELAPEQDLHKQMAYLYMRPTHLIELSIKGQDFFSLVDAIREADELRRELRAKVVSLAESEDDAETLESGQ